MRIETKARHDGSMAGLFVQGGSGATRSALLVRLYGDRQPVEKVFDQVCLPLLLLNCEPFCSTMRPNGLRDVNQPMPRGGSQTKRRKMALQQEPVANCSLAAYQRVRDANSVFHVGPLHTENN